MICGGGYVNTCQGDGGGPLIANIDGKFTLVGITSWGFGCGGLKLIPEQTLDSPGVYADITHARMMKFINQINY